MTHDTPLTKRAYNLGLKAVPNFLSLTVVQIEHYEKHLDQIPVALLRGFIVPDRFTLVAALDIVVPADYVHATQLASFKRVHGKKRNFYDNDITDPNFANATTKLTPGRKFKVKVFHQSCVGLTTSDERLVFLRSQKAVFTGAQGASLVIEQKREELPRGYWYQSFDEKGALFQDADGFHMVPEVLTRKVGVCDFDLGNFERDWRDGQRLLCFCDA